MTVIFYFELIISEDMNQSNSDMDQVNKIIDELENILQEESYNYLYKTKAHVHTLRSPEGALRRHTRGIVDECCKRPCTYNELWSYCGYNV